MLLGVEMASNPVPPPSSELTTAAQESADPPASQLGVHPALLVRLRGEVRVVELAPGEALTIGRADDNDIVVDEAAVSRRHARIENDGGSLVLGETGRNGVMLAKRKVIGRHVLRPGDVLTVGPLEMLVAGATHEVLPRSSSVQGARESAQAAGGVIVAEASMVELFRTVRRLASLDTTVLITGETGAGKEVVAQSLHNLGSRSTFPFIGINAASVPESLLESELFGHEKGAFTGADKKRAGVFQRAHRGTLFLDEIAEMPAALQTKLLRVLETRKVQPVGASEEVEVDVRIVAATHRDLRKEVKEGRFREDLFFRMSAFVLVVPPLRERPSEIALLASDFARRFAERHGTKRPEIGAATFEALRRRRWPGNVRELRNAMEHALVLAEDGKVGPEHLPIDVDAEAAASPATGVETAPPYREQVSSAERLAVENALRDSGGNQSAAARALGISRRTLLYKMERFGIRVRRELG